MNADDADDLKHFHDFVLRGAMTNGVTHELDVYRCVAATSSAQSTSSLTFASGWRVCQGIAENSTYA